MSRRVEGVCRQVGALRRQRGVYFLDGCRLGERGSIAVTRALESAKTAAVEDKVNAAAARFVPNDVPLFDDEARVLGKGELAIAQDGIVFGETVQRRLEVAGEGDGVEALRPPVKL